MKMITDCEIEEYLFQNDDDTVRDQKNKRDGIMWTLDKIKKQCCKTCRHLEYNEYAYDGSYTLQCDICVVNDISMPENTKCANWER
jgi:hypothetical protein